MGWLKGSDSVRGLLRIAAQATCMQSTRKGLRSGELEKDTYERLNCAECEKTLGTENSPDEVYTVRICPDCGKQWKELP